MAAAKAFLPAALGTFLAVSTFDCLPLSTAQQAMECCHSMPCSHHGQQGQDCCRTMAANPVAFVLPAAFHFAAGSLAPAAAVASFEPTILTGWTRAAAAQCHAPPGLETTALFPIRI